MKRIQIIMSLILSLLISVNVYSQNQGDNAQPKEDSKDTGERTHILIDFTQFDEKLAAEDSPYAKEAPENWQNNLNEYVVTQADMGLDNWIVSFNSSSNIITNKKYSYSKKVTTKKGETVLGVRVRFPQHRYYSHAFIRPPYEIMEYNKDGKLVNINNGVVDNVYIVKEVGVEVSGRNYPNRLMLRLKDQNDNYKTFFMGYLNFVGWRRLVWKNANYVASVDHRNVFKPLLYPNKEPYYKFDSFVITRSEDGPRGDFVVYFKKVDINYDMYNVQKDELTIEDENEWGIRKHEALVKEAYLRKKHADERTLRQIELSRMGKNARKPGQENKEAEKEADNNTANNN